MSSLTRFLFFCALVCLGPQIQASTLRIVTDTPVTHSLASMLVRDDTEVALLVSGAESPHHFALKPSQAGQIADADILLWVGSELTPWLSAAVAKLAPDSTSITLADKPGSVQLLFGSLIRSGARPRTHSRWTHMVGWTRSMPDTGLAILRRR